MCAFAAIFLRVQPGCALNVAGENGRNYSHQSCAVVTNLPSAEIKKPLSVRNKLPLESKVVTQITEGRTLASTFANSDDGV